jgi:sulfhydrogenase subunit delta
MGKPAIAVFDLTDCEGCEVQIINLKEDVLNIVEHSDIINWRLVEEEHKSGPFDVALVEGSAQTDEDISLLQQVRKQSTYLIGLGACACIGGIPSLSGDARERERLFNIVYGPQYEPKARESKPIDAYVKVDYYINGCPVNRVELERVISKLLMGGFPRQLPYPVCLECKFQGNECLLVKEKVCLGPITQAGCGAVCVTQGKRCYGCQGPYKAANLQAMQARLREFITDTEIKNHLSMFLESTPEFERLYP